MYNIDQIKQVLNSKGYLFFDENKAYNVNIIGIRSNNTTANSFDDSLHLIYRDDNLDMQNESFPVTTDPGTYWLENPMNVNGTAILVPDQYRGSHKLGLHKDEYKALTQKTPLTVWRDYNRDNTLDFDVPEDEGMFGINIHRSNPGTESTLVEKWSAGCQVFKKVADFDHFIEICEKSSNSFGNSFTYTLLTEEDF